MRSRGQEKRAYETMHGLDSCIHARQSYKYCLIHAIQSGGTYLRGSAYSVFGLLGGFYSRETLIRERALIRKNKVYQFPKIFKIR